jgi:adenine C2-methylase RlmN of 23S rRNA A2503 and tRNA A37
VNLTCEGDWAYNWRNSCDAIGQIAKIELPKISFILTSIGMESALRNFLEFYINIPRVRHYWSVNSLVPGIRGKLMPGTIGQSLFRVRALYQEIAKRTGEAVTISWIVIRGKTDSAKDAEMLSAFLKDRPFRVKLMALSPGSLTEETCSSQDVKNFSRKLDDLGVNVRIREILGADICSGCGSTVPDIPRETFK